MPRSSKSEEAELGDPGRTGTDRRVGVRPVDREADRRPQLVIALLEQRHHLLAQLDEVGTRDRNRFGLRLPGWRRSVEREPEAVKSGSYGSDGSTMVPVISWTRRSTLSPLSSHPIG